MIFVGVLTLLLYAFETPQGQQVQPRCEDRLPIVERQLTIVRTERDRAQNDLAVVWDQREKLQEELTKLKGEKKDVPTPPTN